MAAIEVSPLFDLPDDLCLGDVIAIAVDGQVQTQHGLVSSIDPLWDGGTRITFWIDPPASPDPPGTRLTFWVDSPAEGEAE